MSLLLICQHSLLHTDQPLSLYFSLRDEPFLPMFQGIVPLQPGRFASRDLRYLKETLVYYFLFNLAVIAYGLITAFCFLLFICLAIIICFSSKQIFQPSSASYTCSAFLLDRTDPSPCYDDQI